MVSSRRGRSGAGAGDAAAGVGPGHAAAAESLSVNLASTTGPVDRRGRGFPLRHQPGRHASRPTSSSSRWASTPSAAAAGSPAAGSRTATSTAPPPRPTSTRSSRRPSGSPSRPTTRSTRCCSATSTAPTAASRRTRCTRATTATARTGSASSTPRWARCRPRAEVRLRHLERAGHLGVLDPGREQHPVLPDVGHRLPGDPADRPGGADRRAVVRVHAAENPGEWQTWLAHVKAAGTVPDMITNHDEGDVDDPVTVAQSLNSDLTSAGIGRSRCPRTSTSRPTGRPPA